MEPADTESTLEEVIVEKKTSTFYLDVGMVNDFDFEGEGLRKSIYHPLKLMVSLSLFLHLTITLASPYCLAIACFDLQQGHIDSSRREHATSSKS